MTVSKYPSKEDVEQVDIEQLVELDIEGKWDMTPDARKRYYNLNNSKSICYAFDQHVSTVCIFFYRCTFTEFDFVFLSLDVFFLNCRHFCNI